VLSLETSKFSLYFLDGCIPISPKLSNAGKSSLNYQHIFAAYIYIIIIN
jgi:hypothetical protein